MYVSVCCLGYGRGLETGAQLSHREAHTLRPTFSQSRIAQEAKKTMQVCTCMCLLGHKLYKKSHNHKPYFRSSDTYIRATYETVMSHLSKDHAEIRLSAFQIIDDLFQRSHLFRELLLSDFQKFTRLVTGIDSKDPLPLPKMVASKLKEKSLLGIRQWHDKFGTGYPRLKISYNYLKSNKKVRDKWSIME